MENNWLSIKNFKAYADSSLRFKQLTVLAGANSSGKSSAIQALLLLRKTWELHDKAHANAIDVPLNGLFSNNLGTDFAVLKKTARDTTITLALGAIDQVSFGMSFDIDERDDSKLSIAPRVFNDSQIDCALAKALRQKEFYYLCAERLGPRVSNELSFMDYPHAGWKGETTAQVIALREGFYPIAQERLFQGTSIQDIEDQTNRWLNFILPGARVTARKDEATLSTQLLLENEITRGNPSLATNLGFGLSYVLPIIANGLVAVPNSYFIVENPEAHLHPSAQYRIGQFLSMVAATGTIVVVETHSDHVLNGIQLAVVGGSIRHEDVLVDFFDVDKESRQPRIEAIDIDEKGQLSSWPKGFFDQTQASFAELFKKRKGL